MDIYDVLDKYGDLPRRCPKCGSDDVKFGVHDPAYKGTLGISTSASCRDPDCDYSESGDDPEALFLKWVIPPAG